MEVLPEEVDRRGFWLFVVLVILSVVSLVAMSEVFWTILLAGVFAYVLYPVKERLSAGRLSDRWSAALVTLSGFAFLLALAAPVLIVLLRRRGVLIGFISDLPDEISAEPLGVSYSYPTSDALSVLRRAITDAAVSLAGSIPSLSLKAFLFVFLLYALLKRPRSVERKIVKILPDEAERVLFSYHERVKRTLVGIFAVQTLTSVMTFLISLPVFYLLGYDAFFSLSVAAGLLQFVPIIGPSVLVLGLFALELSAGFTGRAITVLVFGIVVIGFLPDAYLRPVFADRATGLSPSLYFIGFAGGALTLGAVGVLVGPLLVALVLETVELMSE